MGWNRSGPPWVVSIDPTYLTPAEVAAVQGAVSGGGIALAESLVSAGIAVVPGTGYVSQGQIAGVAPWAGWEMQRLVDGPVHSLLTVGTGHATYNLRKARGTAGALTALENGDEIGALAARGHNGTDFEGHSGSLAWYASENHTPSANGTDFRVFVIRNGTVGSFQALEIHGSSGRTQINGGLLVYGNSVESVHVIPDTATVSRNGVLVQMTTQESAFTCADVFLNRLVNTSLGAGSAITRQTGVRVEALSSGASNYSIRSMTAAATNNWNLFADGTAQNYMEGNLGIGVTRPAALIELAAGTATAGTAPLKFTAGTNLTTPVNGVIEYDGTSLYFTTGGIRRTVTLV